MEILIMENGWIEDELYKKIIEKMPIPSVDILTVYKGKLLLLLRNNNPGKNLWWTPGGRVLKGETLEDTAKRELFEETGLQPVKLTKKGVMVHFWPKYQFITTFFLAEVESDNITLDTEHKEYRWIEEEDRELHEYVKYMINKSGLSF